MNDQLELFEDPIPDNVRVEGYTFIEADQSVSLYKDRKLIGIYASYTEAYQHYQQDIQADIA